MNWGTWYSAPAGYSDVVAISAIPDDTSQNAYVTSMARWQAMTVYQRALLTTQICLDVEKMARAGIRVQHPDYTEIEVCHELARRRYGTTLADAAYAGLLPSR